MYRGKRTLSALLAGQAEAFPDRTLFYFQDEAYTYGQVNEAAAHVAAALKKLGVARGDRVIIGLANAPEELIAFAAVARLGAIYIPSHAGFQATEIAYYLRDSQANTVIGTPAFIQKVKQCRAKSVRFLIQIGGHPEKDILSWDELIHEPEMWDGHVTPDDPLAIYYTSGTTGEPKGAVQLNGRFISNGLRLGSSYHYTENDVTINTLPYIHVFAPIVEWIPLMFFGGHFVLRRAFHPHSVLAKMTQYGATFIAGVPAMFMTMYDEIKKNPGQFHFEQLRFAFVGAAPMPLHLQTALEKIMGAPFVQGSGQTESGPLLTLEPLERPDGLHPGTCGTTKIYPDIQTRIVDDQGGDVAKGKIGELITKTPEMMAGYWRRPEATKKAIVDGWLHTGDLAREDGDGYYYLVDRKKSLIIVSGQNVYPAEIEKVIYNLPAVEEVAVIGLPDKLRGESVEAYIVVKDGQTLTEGQVKNYLKGQLTDFKRPRRIHFIDRLPKTASGKIRKGLFRKQILPTVTQK